MPAIPSANSAMPRRSQKSIPSRQASRAACGPSYCQLTIARLLCRTAAARPWPCVERERERPAHVLESLPVPEGGAGRAADAERARRLGQAELGGEGERPLGGRDRLPEGAADDA